jgi:hypothetical protein
LDANVIAADAVPKTPWNLLVPKATNGGTPAINKAGTVIKPPPPEMASTKPANMATKNRINKTLIVTSIMS